MIFEENMINIRNKNCMLKILFSMEFIFINIFFNIVFCLILNMYKISEL